jgi:hypothetical protein
MPISYYISSRWKNFEGHKHASVDSISGLILPTLLLPVIGHIIYRLKL